MGARAAPGDRIGRYVIEGQLGRGGMGAVYRAYDEVLHRHVALKLLHAVVEESDAAGSSGAVARIVREARMVAALDHPNVVAVYDVGEHDGGAFIVMEHVAGTSLAAVLAQPEPPASAQSVAWLTDVARALAAAHRAGLVHRDIKPDNVMVRSDGAVKVLDFGIARPPRARRSAPPEVATVADATGFTLGGTVEDGALVGTPGYIAPEQIRHGVFDARSDQFAWGVLAYELLAGALPWKAPLAEVAALVAATLFDEPAPLTARCPELPPALCDVVHRALAKDPAARFDSMDALLTAWTAAAVPLLGPARGATTPPPEPAAPGVFAAAPTIEAPRVAVRRSGDGARVSTRPSERTPSPTLIAAARTLPDATPGAPSRARRRGLIARGAAALGALAAALAAATAWRAAHPRVTPPMTAAVPRGRAAAPAFVFAPGPVRRVTFDEGCEEFPTFLPGGARLVYDAASGRDYHLFELDLASGARRELTAGEGWDFSATVSPDGRLLAWRHSGGAGGVYLRPYDGSAPARRIAGGYVRPAFSPDGRAVWVGDEAGGLARLDVASGAVQRTLRPPAGALVVLALELPDGRVAARMSAQETNDPLGIALFARDTGALRWLYRGRVANVLARAPDGRNLIVARERSLTVTEPWRVPLDGGQPEPIAGTDVLPIEGLAFSPDGTRVAWSTCTSRPEIAALTRAVAPHAHDGGGAATFRIEPLWTGREWFDGEPCAVPGTDLLLLNSDRGSIGTGLPWLVDRAGRVPSRRLPMPDGVTATTFAVTRDHRLVAAATAQNGIYLLPFDGQGAPRQLTSGASDRSPAFSADGAQLYFESRGEGGHPQVMRVAVEGGGGAAVPVLPPGSARPSVSPDSRLLAYVETGSDDVRGVPWLYELATQRRRRLSPALETDNYEPVRFSPDGRRAAVDNRVNLVVELDVASGAVLARFDAGGDQVGGLTYTDSELITGRAVWSGDLWVADGVFR